MLASLAALISACIIAQMQKSQSFSVVENTQRVEPCADVWLCSLGGECLMMFWLHCSQNSQQGNMGP